MRLPLAKTQITQISSTRVLPPLPLRYVEPCGITRGIIGIGFLLPESIGLIVGPIGCLRHTCFVEQKYGSKGRLYTLQVSESDAVMGQHLENFKKTIEKIASEKNPKAIVVCTTCIDDILGSEFEEVAQKMEQMLNLPIKVVRMNPICRDGKLPSGLRVWASFYDFLPYVQEREPAINILGACASISRKSELYELLAQAGYPKVNQLPSCASFEQFSEMAKASYNLLIRPIAKLWAQKMATHMGIPYCFVPASYGFSAIEKNYQKIGELLGNKLNIAPYREKVELDMGELLDQLQEKKIAVGSSVNGSPFEISRALIEFGFKVKAIFVRKIADYEWEHINWLKEKDSNLTVYRISHPSLIQHLDEWENIDLALGLDAGYYCTRAKTAPISLETQGYGYQNTLYLLKEMVTAMKNTYSHKEMVYPSDLFTQEASL